MRVTFDSNVWRVVSSPEIFPKDKDKLHIDKIRNAIENGKIIPCISETMFTLEGIKNVDRKSFFGGYKAKIDFDVTELENGQIQIGITMEPDHSAHPGNTPHLTKHLTDALRLGFKVLRCPRIGGVTNPDILEQYYLQQRPDDLKEKLDLLGGLLREIESRGCGIKVIKDIGENFKGNASNWHEGIRNAPGSENRQIESAIAEWADGDSVAAHIAYKNDFFCTRDLAKKAGQRSIFSSANRNWIEAKYGKFIVTPKELADELEKIN
ncbi:MAG: hypothetical protein RLO12_23645 [Fulvivirga sp.]